MFMDDFTSSNPTTNGNPSNFTLPGGSDFSPGDSVTRDVNKKLNDLCEWIELAVIFRWMLQYT